ncbi:MAG: CHAT domain-containing protein, partial [Myxococcales bacterium]|nr:CHAT domain-containing protein [Myxococcales bacterium]
MTVGAPPEPGDAASPLSIVLEFTRTENPQDEHAFRFVAQTYTLRAQGGGPELLELDWSEALIADVRALARPGCDAEVAQRIGDALRKALTPTSWRSLGRELAAAADAGRRALVTLRSNAAELYALPWEQLTIDASGRRICELHDVVLRYEWPDTKTRAAEPTPRPAGGRVLVAWSAAGGAVPNAEHLDAIKAAYRDGHLRFDDERDELAHASLDALTRKLARARQDGEPYAILHLLCHGEAVGSGYGLALSDERESRAVIDAAALRRALGPYASTLRLVVLAACNTGRAGKLDSQLGSVAQALHRVGFAAIVASRYPLSVDGSAALTRTLYRALAVELRSLEGAFAAARSALGTHDAASLQLLARAADGDDSRPIVFRPYRGLLAFTAADRRFFCGRDREIAALVARVEAARGGALPRFQLVVGPSGVGKSSLVLGGLIPALRPAARDGSPSPWTCAAVRLDGGLRALWGVLRDLRGERPSEPSAGERRQGPPAVYSPAEVMEEAYALRADDPGGSLLLVVDQFEELF